MRKICRSCNKEFEAAKEFYNFCSNCQTERLSKKAVVKPDRQTSEVNNEFQDLLLNSYLDNNGNPLKQVYLEIPEQLASIFAKEKLSIKQLRDFLRKIGNARIKAISKDINSARSILYECSNDLRYQLRRKVIGRHFFDFMMHHLNLAESNENNLDFFYKHLDSILCNYPERT